MFYLFINGTCKSLCDNKERLQELITDNDSDAVIVENESWLNPSDITLKNGEIVVNEIIEKHCYYNNGLSNKIVSSSYTVSDGEVLFDEIPTSEELKTAFSGYAAALKEKELTALDDIYQPQFTELVQSLGLATLANDTDTVTSIQSDYAELKSEYTTKREAIENGNS